MQINKENIFIEEGAKLTFAFLNATDGPIYVGKDAEITLETNPGTFETSCSSKS